MATAFLITPFNASRAGGEDPVKFAAVQDAVCTAAQRAGVELVHPARMVGVDGTIMEQVEAELRRADLVIAILTGANPNVLYELGKAQSPKILIIDFPESVPFDLRGRRYFTYGAPGELEQLAGVLEASIKETLSVAGKTKWADQIARSREQTDRFLQRIRGTPKEPGAYVESIYVKREDAERRLQEFLGSDKTALVIVGNSGVGLTNLLSHWTQEQLAGGDSVFLYDCKSWTSSHIEQHLNYDFPVATRNELLSALKGIAKLGLEQSRRLIIVFDNIDGFREAGGGDTISLLKEVDAFIDHLDDPNVRVVLACHTPTWRQLGRLDVIAELNTSHYFCTGNQRVLSLQPFSDAEFDLAWSRYRQYFSLRTDLQQLPARVREQLRNPWMLRILAELYRGWNGTIKEIHTHGIFNRYYEQRIKSRGDKHLVETLAAEMLTLGQSAPTINDLKANDTLAREITPDDPNSSYYRLLKNGVFTEVEAGPSGIDRVTFSHLQVAALALARSQRYATAQAKVEFAVKQADRSILGWYAAQTMLLSDVGGEALKTLAASADLGLRELASESLIQLRVDRPKEALALIRDLLQTDAEEARRTALNSAYRMTPRAPEIFLWAAGRSSPELRRTTVTALYLAWLTDPEFTNGILDKLLAQVSLKEILRLPNRLKFFIQLTVTIYINHCERTGLADRTSHLYYELVINRLHLHWLRSSLDYFSGAIASAFSEPIVSAVLLSDLVQEDFFKAPQSEKECFKRIVPLLEPGGNFAESRNDLIQLLESELRPMNVLAAMVLASHAFQSPEVATPFIRSLFEDCKNGRLWILCGFAVLLPDTPGSWTDLLKDLTGQLIQKDPDIFHGVRSPLPEGFEVLLLPLGLAYAKRGEPMTYIEDVIRAGLKAGDLRLVRRCITCLGPIGFYYPDAVFRTLRNVSKYFGKADLQEALISALSVIRTVHLDSLDAFLATFPEADDLSRRTAAAADVDSVRRYILWLGLYNNAIHQALRYPKMRRDLLMHGMTLLADANDRQSFIKPYATKAVQMFRDADYKLINWTTEN